MRYYFFVISIWRCPFHASWTSFASITSTVLISSNIRGSWINLSASMASFFVQYKKIATSYAGAFFLGHQGDDRYSETRNNWTTTCKNENKPSRTARIFWRHIVKLGNFGWNAALEINKGRFFSLDNTIDCTGTCQHWYIKTPCHAHSALITLCTEISVLFYTQQSFPFASKFLIC